MNKFDLLMNLDESKLKEKKTEEYRSERLSRAAGEDVYITLQELPLKIANNIAAMGVNKNGGYDKASVTDVHLMYLVEGIKDPDLRNAELMTKFGAKNPKDLALKLFEAEARSIAGKILTLTDGKDEDEEAEEKDLLDEIKNL